MPNFMCELHEWGLQRHFFARLLGPYRSSQKVKYNFSITKSISKAGTPSTAQSTVIFLINDFISCHSSSLHALIIMAN